MEENKKNEIDKKALLEPVNGAIEYIEVINAKKNIISDALSAEEYSTAFDELSNFIEGINELNKLLNSITGLLKIKLKDLNYKNKNLNFYLTRFNNFLEENLISAIENQDYLFLSDLINYELEEYLQDYKNIFIKLKNYIENSEITIGVISNEK